MKTALVFVLTGLVLGSVVGGLMRRDRSVRIPIARQEKQPTLSLHDDGLQPLISLGLEPSAIMKGSSGEALEYLFTVEPRTDVRADLAIRYSLEIVRDDANPVQSPSISDIKVVPKGKTHSAQLRTPSARQDGYFVVRIQAAGSDGVEDTLQIIERHFSMKSGVILPISPDEYFQNSNSGLARKL